ncbi:hypothetical protein NP233_g10304 [Leucocoprinus birnbaumii]|uniref:Uncharacterized protein n=1 Tax=Leucocoprinus birnbaumii TaxID=56174 RepID=A0AAD5YLF5_9AGAR|nr:hypothetical protein NP233_g10304 [Leucocoprinus birnbaumii]
MAEQDLPTEVVEHVFHCGCSTFSELCLTLCLVSSWTRRLALPHLYSIVKLETQASLVAFHRAIAQGMTSVHSESDTRFPPPRLHVRSLWIVPISNVVVDIFNACKNLERLSVHEENLMWLIRPPLGPNASALPAVTPSLPSSNKKLRLWIVKGRTHRFYPLDSISMTLPSPFLDKITHLVLDGSTGYNILKNMKLCNRLTHLAVSYDGSPSQNLESLAVALRVAPKRDVINCVLILLVDVLTPSKRMETMKWVNEVNLKRKIKVLPLRSGGLETAWEEEMNGADLWEKADKNSAGEFLVPQAVNQGLNVITGPKNYVEDRGKLERSARKEINMAPVSFCELPPTTRDDQETKPADRGHRSPRQKNSGLGDLTPASNLPVVVLDVDILTDTIAARLATSLLGHVLFLKNQIPLPIVQLGRIPDKQGNNKAARLKNDLLSAYDTLSSHFMSTFTALSTALARAKTPDNITAPSRVYLAISVGASAGAAKSTVMYGVDRFQTRIWGTLDKQSEESGDEYPEDSEDEATDDEENVENAETQSEESDAEQSNDKPGLSEDGNEDDVDDDEEEEEEEEEGEEDQEQSRLDQPPPLFQSYAEEQRFLHNAERLLARILAAADANGHGIANEMSPSQTHIFIRAPRRFSHPAWIPRQNLTKQMDKLLADFLEETWPSIPRAANVPIRKKKPVEGVWITGKEGLGDAVALSQPTSIREEDELIWWTWDGKLIGFADW